MTLPGTTHKWCPIALVFPTLVETEPGTEDVQVSAADMDSVVMKIVGQPFHAVTHPDYGTVMRLLDVEVPFQVTLAGHSKSS